MHLFFQLLLALFCLSMFFVRRETKLGILFFTGICIYEYTLPLKIGTAVSLVPLCFFISEWKAINSLLWGKRMVVSIIFYLGAISSLYTIVVSPHLHSPVSLLVFLMSEIFGKFMLPFAALICLGNIIETKRLFKYIYIAILVMTVFSVHNYITRHSVYVDWLFDGKTLVDYLEDAGAKFTNAERFRIQGTFHNPFDYGYTCIVCFLLFYYGRINNYISSFRFYEVTLYCFWGITMSYCRTVWICAIMATLMSVLYYNSQSKRLGMIVFLLVATLFAVELVPSIQSAFDMMISTFDQDSKVAGSSVEMREAQILAVLSLIQGNEFLGMGHDYFSIDLGFSSGKSGLLDSDLQGLEGSYLVSLLETGIIGTLLYFGLIIYILVWSRKQDIFKQRPAAFVFVLFVLFGSFGIMTGELRTAYITFLTCGIAFRDTLKITDN